LLADPAVPSVNDLQGQQRLDYLQDVVRVGDALLEVTGAARINYETWCNQAPSLHTHIVPRYATEPQAQRLLPLCVAYDIAQARAFNLVEDAAFMQKMRNVLGIGPVEENAMSGGLTLYGIKNCDTVRKARNWLEEHDVAYVFHDFKLAGVTAQQLEAWAAQVGWEKLLNRAGTTFRKLPDGDKADLTEKRAIALMVAHPTLIKRPVLETQQGLQVGFKPELYAAALGKS
jgi:arsenate reductase